MCAKLFIKTKKDTMGLLCSLVMLIQFLLFYSLFFSSTFAYSHSGPEPTHECHGDESKALLQFKESFVISKSASYNPSSYPKTSSWKPTTDCCTWDGIQCDNLTNHVIGVDLSSSQLYGPIDANSTLFSLVHLQSLHLSDNNFNGSQIPSKIGELSHIKYLDLIGSRLTGEIPPQISQLHNLLVLDLRSYTEESIHGNLFNQLWLNSSTLKSLIQNATRLEQLRLNYVNVSSSIPNTLTNLTSLQKLSLFGCDLHGEFPVGIFHLPNLTILNLGNNKNLRGMLPDFHSGSLISILNLRYTSFYGPIPLSFGNLTFLSWFSISMCKFYGHVPSSFRNLDQLVTLDLSSNFLEGQVDMDMFLNFKKLTYLSLSDNELSLLVLNGSSNASSLPPLEELDLSSCNLVEFPAFLRDLDELIWLDLSNNDLKSLPNWLWEKTGLESLFIEGSALTGEISPLICNLKSLLILDLAYNNLSGMIPSCLGNFSQSLTVLMLQANKLFGYIPQTYMIGSSLKMIDLGDNNLQGQLPRALVNCKMLGVIDVSNNQLNDSFPSWLGSLPILKVINLRFNEFYGAVSCPSICIFPKLHILDLSHNKFSGNLSSETIRNWKSLTTSNISQLKYDEWYFGGGDWLTYTGYTYTASNKGVVRSFEDIQTKFYFMVTIDLSGNRISGEIPYVIGDLKSLVFLNLSNNMFIGKIPSSLGKLSNLEALDLSLNRLSGKIPQELAELTFLEIFNVSYNKLSGPIPENKQFSTFPENSFEGNQGLCGIQLLKKCGYQVKPPPRTSDGDQDFVSGSFFEFGWEIVLIGYGGGLVAGLALGSAFSSDFLMLLKKIFYACRN